MPTGWYNRAVGFVGGIMRRCLVLALLCCASAAHAKEFRVDLLPGAGQQSVFMQGKEAIVDRQPGSNVLVAEEVDPDEKRAAIIVGVMNTGTAPFNFGPENITVRLGDQTISMQSYDDLMREQKRREGRKRFAMAFAGAMNSMSASQAGQTSGTMTYSGNTNGYVGNQAYTAQTYGTGTYSGYDAGAAEAAQARVDAETARNTAVMESNLAAQRGRIGQTLKINTVMPGQKFLGPIMFDVPDAIRKSKAPVPVTIVLQAGGETHTFSAMVGASKAFVQK